MARRLSTTIALALGLAGCTAQWDSAAPAISLDGEQPSLSSLRKLNTMNAGFANYTEDKSGAPWTAFCEYSSNTLGASSRGCKRMHLARIDGQPGDEVVLADDFAITRYALFVMRDDAVANRRIVTLHRAGDPAADDVSFSMPPGNALIYPSDDGQVFAYWVTDPATTHWDIFRRDRRYQRRFAIPAGIDPAKPLAQTKYDFLLTSDGGTIVVREPDGPTNAWSTVDETGMALGLRPTSLFMDNAHHALLTVGDDGLHQVPLGGGAERVLWPSGFDLSTLALTVDTAYWVAGGDLLSAPLDGSAAATVAQPCAARITGLGPHGEIAYSHDPSTRFVGGAGDGWLGDWNFMERGRRVRFAADGRHIYYLEHAAFTGTVGELMSVTTPDAPGGAGGTPVSLGINVHAFTELPDGRLLSIENHVYAGTWNRLVVIDQAAQTKKWVVPAATEFFVVPGAKYIIADVVSGLSAYDIYLVPVP